jgi:siroheme synthase (precorrin-2 oxidase/ferrochelatase)
MQYLLVFFFFPLIVDSWMVVQVVVSTGGNGNFLEVRGGI